MSPILQPVTSSWLRRAGAGGGGGGGGAGVNGDSSLSLGISIKAQICHHLNRNGL